MQLDSARPGVSHVVVACPGCHKKVAAYEPNRIEWRKKHFHNELCLDNYRAMRPVIVRGRLLARAKRREAERQLAAAQRLAAAIEWQRYLDEQRRRLPVERRREPIVAAARLVKFAMMAPRRAVAT